MGQLALSDHHLGILQRVFAPYRQRIDGVSIFGSRATGRARPNSDIDLVLYGSIDERDRVNIWSDLDDSDLPVTVDLLLYDEITNEALRAHIDRVALPLPPEPALDSIAKAAAG